MFYCMIMKRKIITHPFSFVLYLGILVLFYTTLFFTLIFSEVIGHSITAQSIVPEIKYFQPVIVLINLHSVRTPKQPPPPPPPLQLFLHINFTTIHQAKQSTWYATYVPQGRPHNSLVCWYYFIQGTLQRQTN